MASSECFRFVFIGGFFLKGNFIAFTLSWVKKLVDKNSFTMLAKVLVGPHRNLYETLSSYLELMFLSLMLRPLMYTDCHVETSTLKFKFSFFLPSSLFVFFFLCGVDNSFHFFATIFQYMQLLNDKSMNADNRPSYFIFTCCTKCIAIINTVHKNSWGVVRMTWFFFWLMIPLKFI